MLDASNGSRLGNDYPPRTEHADATGVPAPERRDCSEPHEEAASGTARPEAATLVSIRKIEANRRNAQHSTGPTTDAGKRASRMNALTHGLLAKEVVITRGDDKEDERAFSQLLEELQAQFQPVGIGEELEVHGRRSTGRVCREQAGWRVPGQRSLVGASRFSARRIDRIPDLQRRHGPLVPEVAQAATVVRSSVSMSSCRPYVRRQRTEIPR